MPLVEVAHFSSPAGWSEPKRRDELAREYCEKLEAGDILYFPAVPFSFSEEHRQTLLAKKQSSLRFHKNISYQPDRDILRGQGDSSADDSATLKTVLRDYAKEATRFVNEFLRPYRGKYRLDFTSYRPVEEEGRAMALHKRNDLLHVDAFPSRPTAGGRILRVFVNLNPTRVRSWITGERFGMLAQRYALQAGLEKYAGRLRSPFWSIASRMTALSWRLFGRRSMSPTPYDQFMHHFHNFLKENDNYQKHASKLYTDFPPGSSWLVYTDSVPHAVLSGQFAIEQTFIIDHEGMVTPEQAPIRILEDLCKRKLAA